MIVVVLQFFKNDVSQGVAFQTVQGPVFPAVCMTPFDSQISIVPETALPARFKPLMHAYLAVCLFVSL